MLRPHRPTPSNAVRSLLPSNPVTNRPIQPEVWPSPIGKIRPLRRILSHSPHPNHALRLICLLPTASGEQPLVAIPLVLPMGWSQSVPVGPLSFFMHRRLFSFMSLLFSFESLLFSFCDIYTSIFHWVFIYVLYVTFVSRIVHACIDNGSFSFVDDPNRHKCNPNCHNMTDCSSLDGTWSKKCIWLYLVGSP
jgi:hypothetical protein